MKLTAILYSNKQKKKRKEKIGHNYFKVNPYLYHNYIHKSKSEIVCKQL